MTAPSIVIILADDLPASLVEHTPAVLAMQADGATFPNYIVATPWCCPSRVSLLTGRYTHSHTITRNSGANGGHSNYLIAGLDDETFGTIAQDAGYRTCFYGKFLNNYNPANHARANGWTDWHCSDNGFAGFDWTAGEQGNVTSYGSAEEDYATDVLFGLAVDAIETTALETPLLVVVSTFAPHSPFTPAPRHEGLFGSLSYPFTPAWNHRPTATDALWLQAIPELLGSGSAQTANFRNQARSMQAISEGIEAIRAALSATGRANNTYVIFSSDNGYHQGERSMMPPGKQTPYEYDVRIPMVVVGPGVAAGATISASVQNVDLCPTIAEIAGQPPPSVHQGKSFLPWLLGEHPAPWRSVAYSEHTNPFYDPEDPWGDNEPPSWIELRAPSWLYIEYATGEVEYHDLVADPYELYNTASELTPSRLSNLSSTVRALQASTTPSEALDAEIYIMGNLSTYTCTGMMGLALGAAAFAPAATHYLAAFVAGTEVTGNGYERKAVTNDTTNWPAAAARAKSLGVDQSFATATGGNWGTIDEIRIYDASSGGNELARDTLSSTQVINDGQTLLVEAGAIDIVAASGSLSDDLAEALLDHVFGSVDYTPEVSVEFAYFAGDPQGAGVEITGTDYARIVHDNDTVTWNAAASGATRNLIDFVFPEAGAADWDEADYWAIFDAAGTGLMFSAALPVARAIGDGETETIQAGRIRPSFS